MSNVIIIIIMRICLEIPAMGGYISPEVLVIIFNIQLHKLRTNFFIFYLKY